MLIITRPIKDKKPISHPGIKGSHTRDSFPARDTTLPPTHFLEHQCRTMKPTDFLIKLFPPPSVPIHF